MNQAMKLMGKQFVLDRIISETLKNSRLYREQGYTYPFDTLDEAALTAADAEKHMVDYHQTIDTVGVKPQVGSRPRPSISIKLSALHPRYEVMQRKRALSELSASVLELAMHVHELNVGVTIDAGETDCLELSLRLYEKLTRDSAIASWGESDLIIQAYSRRCLPVLVWLTLFGRELGACTPLRLVKGAYRDSEIKQYQVQGADGYPVHTRKEGINTLYLACTRYLLSKHTRGVAYPQFTSRNAHIVTAIPALAGEARAVGGEERDSEFQCLHGMGDTLYDTVIEKYRHNVRIYVPTGAHKNLPPYLVHCLLGNGANSFFVHKLVGPRMPVETLTRHPATRLCQFKTLANDRISLSQAIFSAGRKSSRGINMNIQNQWDELELAYEPHLTRQWQATSIINGEKLSGPVHEVRCLYNLERLIGSVQYASVEQAGEAFDVLQIAWSRWSVIPVDGHTGILKRFADLLEAQHGKLMALRILEVGKSSQGSIDEIHEVVDSCRYYAQRTRQHLVREELRGLTSERNELFYEGHGISACVNLWNFSLAILLGQISAALVAGNIVLARPTEQTGLIAARVAELMFETGLPKNAATLLPGDSATLGGVFCRDAWVVGVTSIGSTDTIRIINRQPVEKPSAIATLIAETGGQNTIIVGSTTLSEQVIKDAVQSAFTSTGQHYPALCAIYAQQDITEWVIELLKGAVAELEVGPTDVRANDVDPVIDAEARAGLEQYIVALKIVGKLITETKVLGNLNGHFIAPAAPEISGIDELKKENFGPVLHMVRYATQDLEKAVQAINVTDFGLTMGIHSRNKETIHHIEELARIGNLYINRSQIGMVVGVQPLGGHGLPGIDPKVGGPNCLPRFVSERTMSMNTAAVSGNASLLLLTDAE